MISLTFNHVYLLFILIFTKISASLDECPISKKCECKTFTQRDGPEWLKVKCGSKEKLESLDELDLLNLAGEIVQLNLSGNFLTEFVPKVQLVALQKLDLSKNRLMLLEDRQFIEVPNLRRLDISSNFIKHIQPSTFVGLQHLERLKLNQNQLSTIPRGAFDSLTSLKQLDISNNPLTCDCDLLWLLQYSERNTIKLNSNPRCTSPPSFRGIPLKKLQIGVDIHCKSHHHHQIPVIDLQPTRNQVVFSGDRLTMSCRAPGIIFDKTSRLEWTWLDSNPRRYFDDVVITEEFSPESGVVDSRLEITKLNGSHTGIWSCQMVSGSFGNFSKGVMVIVISDETKYCREVATAGNKGSYLWPRSVLNNTVEVGCAYLQGNVDEDEQKASYHCSSDGEWVELNTSRCTYVSETTRILQQFSKVNLSLSQLNIVDTLRHFSNQTSNARRTFRDAMDVVYAVRTVENYAELLATEPQIGTILMDISDALLTVPVKLLAEAETEDSSCTKLRKATELVARYTSSSVLQKSNVAVEQFPVKRGGLTCTWYSQIGNDSERYLHCVTSNTSQVDVSSEREIIASVQIPASLNIESYLVVSMFRDGRLFPNLNGDNLKTSTVVGVNANIVYNSTEPIYIMMKPPYADNDALPKPMHKSYDSDWSDENCAFTHEIHDHIVFSCRSFGYYTLIKNTTTLDALPKAHPAKFHFSHPAIYVGSFILMTSLLISVTTYLLCFDDIQMPRKGKHALLNVWIAVFLLNFSYIFGIYQTEDGEVCQMVGLSLHYLSLCCLFWITVCANATYKRLGKHETTIELDDDLSTSEKPIEKPILGLYLVGWGISLIICGISAAVNMKHYAGLEYCFLMSGPALSALLVPFVVLVVIITVFFSLIRCAIYNSDANGHLSEGTQATENMDLDLLEPNCFPNDSRSVKTASTIETEDGEHLPSTQLKAQVLFLILFLITWITCAMTTENPLKQVFPVSEDILAVAFAIFSSALGAFTCFFYCVARNDVRSQWMSSVKSNTCRNEVTVPPAPVNKPLVAAQDLNLSRSSSRSSSNKNSNMMKAAADLNVGSTGFSTTDCSSKVNNVNLVLLHQHRGQFRIQSRKVPPNLIENPTSSEIFYNPHQATVARKFFRKQKRNMLKRNNLDVLTNREANNSDSASAVSIHNQNFLSMKKGKVNNTNIHVEHICNTKTLRNPNILSDSYEEYDVTNDIPEKLVKTAEQRRMRTKKKQHNLPKTTNDPMNDITETNNMRSVSQQCTLDYSSETISDSILDKTSETTEQQKPEQNKVYEGRCFARTSSVSASELDELYQQIRSGPMMGRMTDRRSPCLTDSEISSFVGGGRRRRGRRWDSVSEKHETRV